MNDSGTSEDSCSEPGHSSRPIRPRTPVTLQCDSIHEVLPASEQGPSEIKSRILRSSSVRARILENTLARLSGIEGPRSRNDKPARSSSVRTRSVLRRQATWSHPSSSSHPNLPSKAIVSSQNTPESYAPPPSNSPQIPAESHASPLLSSYQLNNAASVLLLDHSGKHTTFISLITPLGLPVLFVGHWASLDSRAHIQQVIKRLGLRQRLVVVGNGPYSDIDKCREACSIPDFVELYSEPSLRIYRALELATAPAREGQLPKRGSTFAAAIGRAFGFDRNRNTTLQLGGDFWFETEGQRYVFFNPVCTPYPGTYLHEN